MPFHRAYTIPAALSANHPAPRAARKPPSDWFIGLILTFALCASAAYAEDPPPDLVKRVVHEETEAVAARDNYTYHQTVVFAELNDQGAQTGVYREERDIIFSPQHERTEQMIGQPIKTLKHLVMTDEDFADMRDMQPFYLTQDQLWNYDIKSRGDEIVDSVDCWVLQVRPRQILQGQRLFEGLIWIDKRDYTVIRLDGQAMPQIHTTKSENLFPHFTSERELIDGKHRFPVLTYADDALPFRTGTQRVRMTIRYTAYKRFSADSAVQYEKR